MKWGRACCGWVLDARYEGGGLLLLLLLPLLG